MSPATAISGALLVVFLMWTLGSLTTRPTTPALVGHILDVSSDDGCLCYDHILNCSSKNKSVFLPEHICDEKPTVIDVSWNTLSSADMSCYVNKDGTLFCGIPSVFVEHVEVFLVHGNQLDTFRAHGDAYTRLRILNLSLNRISEAQFYSMEKMEILDFSFNNLTTVPWTDIRESFPNVREIDLSHNFISLGGLNEFRYAYNVHSLNLSHNNISAFYQHGIEDLLFLQTLDLSENPLQYIKYEFSSLRNLKYLYLSNATISGLLTETFYCLEFLQILDLSRNNLTIFPKGVFRHAVNLQYLDLSHNKLNEIEFKEVGDELNTYQRCYNNSRPPLNITLRMLRTLDLSDNQIERIRSDTFPALAGLGTLNLSRNALSYFTGESLQALEDLEVLDLSYNRLTGLPPGAFAASKNLISLNISNNFLLSLGGGGAFVGLAALRALDASWNFVAELEAGELDPLVRLERLDLSWNVLRRMPDAVFERLTELRWLNVSNNQLQTLPEKLLRNCRVEVSLERNELTSAPVTCSTHDQLWYYARLERGMYWPTAYLLPLAWALLLAAAIIFAAILDKRIAMTPIRPVLVLVEEAKCLWGGEVVDVEEYLMKVDVREST